MTYKTLLGEKFADFKKFHLISMGYTILNMSDFYLTEKSGNQNYRNLLDFLTSVRLKLCPEAIPKEGRTTQILHHLQRGPEAFGGKKLRMLLQI